MGFYKFAKIVFRASCLFIIVYSEFEWCEWLANFFWHSHFGFWYPRASVCLELNVLHRTCIAWVQTCWDVVPDNYFTPQCSGPSRGKAYLWHIWIWRVAKWSRVALVSTATHCYHSLSALVTRPRHPQISVFEGFLFFVLLFRQGCNFGVCMKWIHSVAAYHPFTPPRCHIYQPLNVHIDCLGILRKLLKKLDKCQTRGFTKMASRMY